MQEHLRIIDDETFYVVQANLDARANMYANKPHTPVATCSNALLSGFIFCGHCGVVYPIREEIPVMLIEEAIDRASWDAGTRVKENRS